MLLAKPVSPAVRRLQETVWDDAALSARFDGIDAAMTHSSAEGSSGDPICNKWLVLDSVVTTQVFGGWKPLHGGMLFHVVIESIVRE